MTNEQAKSELMQIYMSLSEEKKKALDVAFKAMEQADGEYISRNNAITSICQWGTTLERTGIYTITVAEMKQTTTDMLCELPSAAIPSAEPKTGHWEMCEDADGIYGVCDICGTDADFTHYGKAYPYCPNCGAKMVEPIYDTCEYTTAAFNPCNACKDKSEYKPQKSEE